jgi:nitrogen fixation protein FixH
MRALALFMILMTLTACTAPAEPVRQEQVVDGLTITFEALDSARINTAQEFLITLTDATGNPVTDATVYLDLDMPAMPMATNRPVADNRGDGSYRAEGAYTMAGEWEIVVVAGVAGVEYRAVFARDAVT